MSKPTRSLPTRSLPTRSLSPRSLFARLLVAQIAFLMALSAVFGTLLYVQRNQDTALLYAQLWAPQLAQALGATGAQRPEIPAQLRTGSPPASAYQPLGFEPRLQTLRQALFEYGIAVDSMQFSLDNGQPILWLQVRLAAQPVTPIWLGLQARAMLPEWSARSLWAGVLMVLLVVGVSWLFTRSLARRLHALSARMQAHGNPPQAALQTPAAALKPTPTGSLEITAIETAYADLLARLQQHERERALLLAGVSHDLRSPLSRIRLAAGLLPDSPEIEVRRAVIVRNVDNADRLIGSFLDYVRAGELPLNETVDLAEIARTAAARFEQPAPTLSVQAAASLPWTNCNALLMDRLISNLIDNALKHGKSPVVLSVGSEGFPVGGVRITVQDAGPGMSPTAAQALQEAFARGDSSRSTPGSGLGLAIVRQIVLRLGGELQFEQTPAGNQVSVWLQPVVA